MFGISPMQLIIILAIVVLLFGTKKLRSLGGDLGSAVKGFKKAVTDKDEESDADFKDDKSKEVEDKSTQTNQSTDDLNKADTKTQSKAE